MITPQDMMMIGWYKKQQSKKLNYRMMNNKILGNKNK